MSNHWTTEQRKRQADLIRKWKPWEKSTGPKSPEGKKRAVMRALKTGEHTKDVRNLRKLIGDQNRLLRRLERRIRKG